MGKKGDKKMDSLADYKRMDNAKTLTMEYYFKDPEWFDKIDMGNGGTRFRVEKNDRTYESTGIQPIRCIKCSKPFQKLPVHRSYGTHTHLNINLFKGLLMEKGVCHECK
tara:strand:- start:30 stop:356 length:327 start_codon:yes stop_codon:yes gene_type:complete